MRGRAPRPTTLAQAVSTIAVGGGASKVLLLGSEFLLARLLGTSGFGRYAVGSSLIVLLSSMTPVGMDYSAIQLLARYRDAGDRLRRAAVVRIGLLSVATVAGLTGLALLAGGGPISRAAFGGASGAGGARIIQAVGAGVVFESLNNYLSAVLRAEGRFWGHVAVFDGIRNVGLAAGCALVALAGVGVSVALTAFAIGSGLGTIVGLWWIVRLGLLRRGPGEPGIFKEMTQFARSLAVWGVLQNSSSQAYVVVAGFFLADREVGALAVGLRVVVLLNFLRTAVTAGVQRDFARLHVDGHMDRLEAVLQRVSAVLFVASGAICIPFLVGPGTVMRAFGAEWVPFAWILWPLLIPKLANVAGGPVGQLLIACGRGKAMLVLNAFEIAVQLAFLVPLMIRYGLAGAVAGEAIRVAVLLLARQLAVRRLLGVVATAVEHLGVLGALGAAVGAGAGLYRLVGGMPSYVVSVLVAAVGFEVLLRVVARRSVTPLGLVGRGLQRPRMMMAGGSKMAPPAGRAT